MSGFWGIFRPDGGPVDMEAFNQMCKASEREGFDGMETHVESGIAMGHLMLRVSPESQYDKQPLKSDCGNYLLVGHFRLDYRDELGDKLGLTQSELEKTPDSRLAMMSYIKWKEKCVHHLEGDWAFAIFNIVTSYLFIAKDKFGYSTVFYFKKGDFFFFSSDILNIVEANKCDIEIDLKQFARISTRGIWFQKGMTLINNLFNLEGSNFLSINGLSKVSVERYFKIEDFSRILFKRHIDYALELESLLQSAIKSKTSVIGDVGLYLSSGIDSSTICYYLLNVLKVNSRVLNSYTSYPQYKSGFNFKKINVYDESQEVLNFSKKFSNISSNILNFSGVNIFESTDNNDSLWNPVVSPNEFWLDGIMNLASQSKIKRIFNAQIGNFTISCNGQHENIDLLLSFKMKRFYEALTKFCHLKKISISRGFFLIVLYPLYKYAKTRLGQIKLRSFGEFEKRSLLKKGVLKKIQASQFVSSLEFDQINSDFLDSRLLRKALFTHISGYVNNYWYLKSCKYGLEVCDPTLDERVLKYSFCIPERLYNHIGEEKYLIKLLMKGKLPDSILFSENKSFQAIDIYERTINDLQRIKEEVIAPKSDLINELLDSKKIQKQLSSFSSSSSLFEKYLYAKEILYINSIIKFVEINSYLFKKNIYLPAKAN